MAAKTCSSCGHEGMEPGWLSDTSRYPGYEIWIRGKLEIGMLGGPKMRGRDRIDVQAYRCTACGHLDLFAENLFF